MGEAAPVAMMLKHAKAEYQPAIVVPFIKWPDAVEERTNAQYRARNPPAPSLRHSSFLQEIVSPTGRCHRLRSLDRSSPLSCSISSIGGVAALDDRTVGQPDHLVDDRRGRLAPAQVRDHRSLRHVGQHELRDPELLGIGFAEGIARKFLVAG